jgi:hypothetical protein
MGKQPMKCTSNWAHGTVSVHAVYGIVKSV